MSGVLLDTCVVRKWFAGSHPVIEAKIAALPDAMHLYVSAITRGEIEFAHTNAASEPAEQARFRRWIREKIHEFDLQVTGDTAEHYSKLRRACFDKYTKYCKYTEMREDLIGEKCGIDENDLWLAAQAIQRNLTLITCDKMKRIREIVAIVDKPDRIDFWPDA